MFQEQSNWLDRHFLLNKLLEENISIKEISKKIGVTSMDINNYLIHHELPTEIVNKAYKNKGSFQNLELIRRLHLHPFLKFKLYQSAVLPIRDYNRLTTDRFQKVLWLINIKEFRLLDWQEQWRFIQQAITYKEILVDLWEKECLKEVYKKGHINEINPSYLHESFN